MGNMHACNMYSFDGFGSCVSRIFDTIVRVCGWRFSIACYIEYVWNVYEVGMAYALISHEMCQEYMWNSRKCAGNFEGNMHGVWMEYAWSHFCKMLQFKARFPFPC